jgi:hypothetical protein
MSPNGKIHAIGGRDPNDRVQATPEIYDPKKGVWTSAAPLPIARDRVSAVVAMKRGSHVMAITTASVAPLTTCKVQRHFGRQAVKTTTNEKSLNVSC